MEKPTKKVSGLTEKVKLQIKKMGWRSPEEFHEILDFIGIDHISQNTELVPVSELLWMYKNKYLSNPIVLNIKNTSKKTIEMVQIGNGFDNYPLERLGQKEGIEIKSNVSGVTYRSVLADSIGGKIKIKRTMIITGDGSPLDFDANDGSIDITINLTVKDIYGSRCDRILFTKSNILKQTNKDRAIDDSDYYFGGYTIITFNEILAGQSFILRLYPEKVNERNAGNVIRVKAV